MGGDRGAGVQALLQLADRRGAVASVQGEARLSSALANS